MYKDPPDKENAAPAGDSGSRQIGFAPRPVLARSREPGRSCDGTDGGREDRRLDGGKRAGSGRNRLLLRPQHLPATFWFAAPGTSPRAIYWQLNGLSVVKGHFPL